MERELPDSKPDPEALAARSESRTLLHGALASLSSQERLLIRLRFEQDLRMAQIAQLTGFESAAHVERRIRKLLQRLRVEFAEREGSRRRVREREIDAVGAQLKRPGL